MQELKAKVLLAEQDPDQTPHLAEAKEASQDQVPPQLVVIGIFPCISTEAILPPLEVSLRTELALGGGEDPRRGYFCFSWNFLNLLSPAPFLKMILF